MGIFWAHTDTIGCIVLTFGYFNTCFVITLRNISAMISVCGRNLD